MQRHKDNEIKNITDVVINCLLQWIMVVIILLMTENTKGVLGRSRTPRPNLPTFRNTPSNFTFQIGDLAVIYCSIENLGTRAVIWRKASQPTPLTIGELTYVPDDRFKLHHIPDKGEWNLFIKNIQPHDAGMYECQISSKEKYIRKMIQVNVIAKQYGQRAIHVIGPHQVEKGGILVLFCNATGGSSTPSDIDWLKNNRKIVTNKSGRINITKHISYVTMTTTSNLTVKQINPDDDAVYTCRTSDEMVKNITVKVTGGGSEKPKRTIPLHKPSKSSAVTFRPSAVIFISFAHSFLFTRTRDCVECLTLQLLVTIVHAIL